MKILKYIFLSLFLPVLLFFAVGFLKPVVKYGHTITVDKSAREAWAVHQDETKYKQWLKGFKSIELIEGNAGEVGSKYKVVVNPGEGQPDFVMTETLTDKKEYEQISMDFDSDMMQFEQTTTFAEKNGKTTVSTDSKVRGKGAAMRSLFALMEMFTGSFQKQEEENIENLKKVIEANAKNY